MVSRKNCKLSALGGRWFVEDLGSANGTTVNGGPVTAATPLHVGDELALGGVVRFVVEGIDPHTSVAPDTGSMPATRIVDADRLT